MLHQGYVRDGIRRRNIARKAVAPAIASSIAIQLRVDALF
jgi:hypothetical protein